MSAARTTGWLDGREQRAWRSLVALRTQLFRHLERQLHDVSDLSGPDYEVLVNLSEAPEDQLRSYELCDAMHWEKSRLSHQLSRMERRGLVERRDCPTDARGAYFGLTADGRAAIEAAAPLHVEEIRRVFIDVLSREQLDPLTEIGDTVAAALHVDTGRRSARGRN